MPVGSRFLTRGLDAWIGLLEALGARGTHWEWRKRAWRQSLETKLAEWENVERSVRTTTRMCRSCRTLIEGGASACPSCGASLSGVPRGGLWRLLGFMVPGVPTTSVLLVSANVGMMVLALLLWGAEGSGLLTFLSPPPIALYLLGGKYGPAISGGEPWRIITANYLHGGLLHLFVNCYTLMSLGPLIEESFGGRKLFVLYTLSGVAGFMASNYVHPQVLSIGASAALFGLLGFAIVYGRFRAGPSGRQLAGHLTRWLMYGLVMFLIPGIDNMAHLGGLAMGAVLALVIDGGEPRRGAANAAWWVASLAALAVTLGAFAMMALSYRANLEALSR
jgi:rhomboid protease GluP